MAKIFIDMPESDKLMTEKTIIDALQPIPMRLYDNGLNILCTYCGKWFSKRIFPDYAEARLCPDHFYEAKNIEPEKLR